MRIYPYSAIPHHLSDAGDRDRYHLGKRYKNRLSNRTEYYLYTSGI
jgi:hypothetical protein